MDQVISDDDAQSIQFVEKPSSGAICGGVYSTVSVPYVVIIYSCGLIRWLRVGISGRDCHKVKEEIFGSGIYPVEKNALKDKNNNT